MCACQITATRHICPPACPIPTTTPSTKSNHPGGHQYNRYHLTQEHCLLAVGSPTLQMKGNVVYTHCLPGSDTKLLAMVTNLGATCAVRRTSDDDMACGGNRSEPCNRISSTATSTSSSMRIPAGLPVLSLLLVLVLLPLLAALCRLALIRSQTRAMVDTMRLCNSLQHSTQDSNEVIKMETAAAYTISCCIHNGLLRNCTPTAASWQLQHAADCYCYLVAAGV